MPSWRAAAPPGSRARATSRLPARWRNYAAQVGSAHLGAVTHSGNARWDVEPPAVG